MSAVEDSIRKFLSDSNMKVAVLKGAWGVGKTFFWKNLIESEKKKIPFKAYSYVSLFGIESIKSIKEQISSNYELLDEKSFLKNLEKVKPFSNILRQIDIPYFGSSSAAASFIEDKILTNFLICIDDFERKEKSISTSSILGLITSLCEEKNCKVLMIFNDSKLEPREKKELDEYREKVVDIEVSYKPSIKDNLDIIWPSGCNESVSDIFYRLNLNNIRIMHRTKLAVEYFEEILEPYNFLKNSLKSRIATLAVIYHGFGNLISIQEATSDSYYDFMGLKNDNEDPKELEKRNFLETLEFIPDEIDQVIIDFLQNGYIEYDYYKQLLEKKNEFGKNQTLNAIHREIWRKFHSNFVTSQEDFVKEQASFLQENAEGLSLRDLIVATEFLKELDESLNFDDLTELAIDRYVENIDRFESLDLDHRLLTPAWINRIKEKFESKPKKYSIGTLFEMLAGTDSHYPEDLKHLLGFSEDDFFQWLTTEKELKVISLTTRFIRRFSDNNEEGNVIISRIKSALERIKLRSKLDCLRIKNFIERQ